MQASMSRLDSTSPGAHMGRPLKRMPCDPENLTDDFLQCVNMWEGMWLDSIYKYVDIKKLNVRYERQRDIKDGCLIFLNVVVCKYVLPIVCCFEKNRKHHCFRVGAFRKLLVPSLTSYGNCWSLNDLIVCNNNTNLVECQSRQWHITFIVEPSLQ